jgi:hypothetical protein
VSSESESLPPRHRSSRPRGSASGVGEVDREGLGEGAGEAMAVGAGWVDAIAGVAAAGLGFFRVLTSSSP